MIAFQCRPLVVAVLLLIVTQLFFHASVAARESVTIPAGTPVLVALEESVRPASVTVNQQLVLHVTSVVRINGEVVIAEGATAVGQVTRVEKRGPLGKPAILHIEVMNVEAVDGTKVVVTGRKSIEGKDKLNTSLAFSVLCFMIGPFIRGGDVELPAGFMLNVTVAGATTIEVGR